MFLNVKACKNMNADVSLLAKMCHIVSLKLIYTMKYKALYRIKQTLTCLTYDYV